MAAEATGFIQRYASSHPLDLAGALASYMDGLTVFERLAKADPGNAEWQRDLPLAY